MSKITSTLEDNPFPIQLHRGAAFKSVQCMTAYDESLPDEYRRLVAKAGTDDSALNQVANLLLAQYRDLFAARMGTTQAIDIIQGGVKVNALPEHVLAVVDHRIADWRFVADIELRCCR
jgi:Gly-Xaa carboxypeptidase